MARAPSLRHRLEEAESEAERLRAAEAWLMLLVVELGPPPGVRPDRLIRGSDYPMGTWAGMSPNNPVLLGARKWLDEHEERAVSEKPKGDGERV